MKFWKLIDLGTNNAIAFYADTAKAHEAVKRRAPNMRPLVGLVEVDVPTDKASIAELLNGGTLDFPEGARAYRFTARGGMQSTTNEEL